ncbi:hypothetical protein SLE2022_245270 [Rubroshorea leprosula]
MKRFRIPSSSGFTDDRVLNPPMATATAAAAFNSTVPPFSAQQIDSEVYPGASFSVSETATEDGENVGNFLERCFLCKKMLNQKNEVYMYGIFQAFCTPECRDKQIDIDHKMKKVCKQSGGGASAGSSRKSKNQSGSQHPGKHAAVQFHI